MRKVMRTADASDQNRRGVNGSFPLNYIRFWLMGTGTYDIRLHGQTWLENVDDQRYDLHWRRGCGLVHFEVTVGRVGLTVSLIRSPITTNNAHKLS